ncbi:hypothetical protein Ciccas_001915 [Cichlidogyrus casuarinus]|uniref:EGF-like domain-containing protein n=1 Tax=Cichlidogyrus casuarinus TaxID=1844966 RepID=A0ABD2QIX1_9PLAT
MNGYTCDCPCGFAGKTFQLTVNLCALPLRARPQLVIVRENLTSLSRLAVEIAFLKNDAPFSNVYTGPCDAEAMVECVPQPGNFICLCKFGFTGQFCEKEDACSAVEPSFCFNGGQCRNASSGASIPVCDYPRCSVHESPCADRNLCRSGGTCRTFGLDEWECICPSGTEGKFCEIDTKNECEDCRHFPMTNTESALDGNRILTMNKTIVKVQRAKLKTNVGRVLSLKLKVDRIVNDSETSKIEIKLNNTARKDLREFRHN